MDKREYLNQISPESALPKPVRPSLLDKILKSKFTWIGLGVVVLLMLGSWIYSLVQQNKPNLVYKVSELTYLIDSTKDIVDQYQSSLKSSDLRGDSADLGTVLADTNSRIDSYIVDTLHIQKQGSTTTVNEITQQKAQIIQELNNAAVNGHLDRTYATKMAYLITLIKAREDEILKMTTNNTIVNTLTSSQRNLQSLYDEFYNFEGTN